MNNKEIVDNFLRKVKSNKDVSEAVCAVETLIECIQTDKNTTLKGLLDDLKSVVELLTNADDQIQIAAIQSSCDLFIRSITLTMGELDNRNFEKCKEILVKKGVIFLKKCENARTKISQVSLPLSIRGKILVHSYSRVVLHLLKEASEHCNILVYVTESMPDKEGVRMSKDLHNLGINSIVILDAAIGYMMEQIDLVLMGAEVVCQSGGVLNKIGSYSIALCAHVLNKPVYIAVESFKFAKLYPLNNKDIPNIYKYRSLRRNENADLTQEHSVIDYIPPSFINYVLTDLGILTPAAICDELLNLYI